MLVLILSRSKTKIVLFHPRVSRPDLHRLPWSILQLAGNIDRERFEIVLVDGGKEPDAIGALVRAAEGARVAGISCFTGNQTVAALKAARALRRAHPALSLVWGGAHPSMYVRETIADPNVDVVVKGQGEHAFACAAEALAEGSDPKDIAGVTYKTKKGEVIFGARNKMRDQNAFGRPPFEAIDPSRYLVHIMVGKKALTYHSSTGCPFPCSFCTVNYEFELGWTGYGAERVVDELSYLLSRAPAADAIEFADSNLIVNTKRTIAIAEGMLRKAITRPWIAFGRPDQLARMPREVWKLLYESGCRRFFVGIESGDPEILKRVKKEHTVDEIMTMAERMAEFGITPDLSFTLGYPGDPERDVRMSLDLARRLKSIVPSAVFILNTYTPYEGTPLFSDAVSNGLRATASLSEWETERWRSFGFRKNVTPWMTEKIDRLIRDFETIAGAAFFLDEDLYRFKCSPLRARSLRDAMITLAKRRWQKGQIDRPIEIVALRRLLFALNPSLGEEGSPFVDGHQAGVKEAAESRRGTGRSSRTR
jgi:radical SAM superfamily enzyme YgiQ (UPF0313 family)